MKKNCLGFTLIELLIAISIIGIIFTIGLARYNQFNRRQILVQAARELESNLRLAQSKALGGEKPTGCDVLSGHRLEFLGNDGDYKIVAVCSGGEIDVKTGLTLGSNITKTLGPSSILFKVLAQGVEGAGTITLSSSGVGEETVTVTEVGEIYIGTAAATPTPTSAPTGTPTPMPPETQSYSSGCTACCGEDGWAPGCPPQEAEPLSCGSNVTFVIPAGRSQFNLQNWQYRMLISHGEGKTQIDTVRLKVDGDVVWSTNPYWCPTSGGSPCCNWDNDSGWQTGGGFGPYSTSPGSSHIIRIECEGSGADGWEGFRCEQSFNVEIR